MLGGELGTIKSINVNVGPLSQPCNLPAEPIPAGMDWDMWLGPAPWAPYNHSRCDGNFGTSGGSWRSYCRLFRRRHDRLGCASFRRGHCSPSMSASWSPWKSSTHDDKHGKFLTYRFPNGLLVLS